MLLLPNRWSWLFKTLTLIVSAVVFIQSIRIFNLGQLDYAWSVLQIDNLKLDLLLSVKPLGAFILLFAMGFGLLITLYSIKSMAGSSHLNIYYGSILLT